MQKKTPKKPLYDSVWFMERGDILRWYSHACNCQKQKSPKCLYDGH